MKTTMSITAISGFLSVVLAQPHLHNHLVRHNNHQLHARDHHQLPEKREIVWDTVWEVVTETVALTTTIVVNPEAFSSSVPASTSDAPGVFVEPTTSSVSVAPTTSSIASSSDVTVVLTPSTFVKIPSSSIAVPTPSAVYIAPTTSSIYVAPTTISSVYVAPTTISSVYVAPTTISSVYVAPTIPIPVLIASTSAAAAAPSSLSSASGSCSSSSPCSGDLTYYTTGEGACGWTNDGTAEHVVALSHIMMGSVSNDGSGSTNSYCGKHITIKYGSSTTTAKVVDKCMGCDKYAIDLSTLAFSDLSGLAAGRVNGHWWFND